MVEQLFLTIICLKFITEKGMTLVPVYVVPDTHLNSRHHYDQCRAKEQLAFPASCEHSRHCMLTDATQQRDWELKLSRNDTILPRIFI